MIFYQYFNDIFEQRHTPNDILMIFDQKN